MGTKSNFFSQMYGGRPNFPDDEDPSADATGPTPGAALMDTATAPPLPSSSRPSAVRSAWFRHYVIGNKRVMVAGLVGLSLVYVLMPKSRGKGPGADDLKPDSQAESVRAVDAGGRRMLSSPDIESSAQSRVVPTSYVNNDPSERPVEVVQEGAPSASPTPAADLPPRPGATDNDNTRAIELRSVATVASSDHEDDRGRQGRGVMRAGRDEEVTAPPVQLNAPAPPTLPAAPTAATPEALPARRGVRIAMEMIDPFQSGIGAYVRARVTADVIISESLTLPRGTEVYIPFVETEAQGRVTSDASQPSFLLVGEKQYSLAGTVYGMDRLKGVPGRRVKNKKSGTGANILKRAGDGLTQTAEGIIGTLSPIPLYGVTGAMRRQSNGGGVAAASEYTVVVPERTKFEFVAGL